MGTTASPEEDLRRLFPDMVEWRRYLHRNPELSFQEKKTSAWIAQRLRGFGCEVREGIGGYGVKAVIRGALPGPAVALRADIDALPIEDEKTVEYRSSVSGAMHACGHDAHTAGLLGVARYYMDNRSALTGDRVLLFQPAEEVAPGGAVSMIRDGALEGVDAIYGVHLWTPLAFGKTATKAGPLMAAVDDFYIDITGKGGHGALPHQTVDAVLAGSAVVQAVQSIVSRSVDPLQPAVVTVGSIQAGTAANVIADGCRLTGTVRTFDDGTRKLVKERFRLIVEQTCALYGAGVKLDYREGYPAVVNDAVEAARFFKVAPRLFGAERVEAAEPVMAGEDFAYYLREVPGCFLFVGAGNEDCGAVYPHHHPRFDVDERGMLMSAALLIAMADDYAGMNKTGRGNGTAEPHAG
ncbi:peptidase M20 [Paenibacillus darwinianus]|uniref:Peptidase M20 n=1 Tax=Paenibacillus darwinianus TaxID=1380763 RepID=A0A9W5S0X3_9BACL|nr:amidohydrolase [Paenibacillus darwinianus]EXX88086.1 peptidase M20 [Paenibacillus darwinianus]EXX88374.1 peptidase M20 [Paenibacillus darwinianus]EXX89930.1 peptidase M20 [Paenibacillus darwinianus]